MIDIKIDEAMAQRLEELKGLLDADGFAPASNATPQTKRISVYLSKRGVKWSDAVKHVGGYPHARGGGPRTLQDAFEELRGMLDEHGVAPKAKTNRDTNRLINFFASRGLTWTDAVHKVGGMTASEYQVSDTNNLIEELRGLMVDGIAPPTTDPNSAAGNLQNRLSSRGISWSEACRRAGGKSQREARAKKETQVRKPKKVKTKPKPTAPLPDYLGEFKQCRKCYWHDANGHCPVPSGRCLQGPYVAKDYGTFSSKRKEASA